MQLGRASPDDTFGVDRLAAASDRLRGRDDSGRVPFSPSPLFGRIRARPRPRPAPCTGVGQKSIAQGSIGDAKTGPSAARADMGHALARDGPRARPLGLTASSSPPQMTPAAGAAGQQAVCGRRGNSDGWAWGGRSIVYRSNQ